MSTIFANVSGIAALAIIVSGVLAIAARLIVAMLGRTFDPSAQPLVDTLISLLVGLAIGSGAGGSAIALKLARAMEMSAQVAMQGRENYPPPPPPLDPQEYVKAK